MYAKKIISIAYLFPQINLQLNCPPVTWVLMPGLRSPVSGPLKLVEMFPRTLRAPAELDIFPVAFSNLFLSYLSLKILNFVSELNVSSGKTFFPDLWKAKKNVSHISMFLCIFRIFIHFFVFLAKFENNNNAFGKNPKTRPL